MMYTNEEDFIIEGMEPVVGEDGIVTTWTARIIHNPSLKMFLNSFEPPFKKRVEDYTSEDFENLKFLARHFQTHDKPFTYAGEGTPLDSVSFPDE